MFGNTFDGVFRNTYVIDADGTIALAYEGVSPRTTRSRSSTTSTYWTADTPLASTTFLEQPADPGEKPRYLVGDRVPLEETEPHDDDGEAGDRQRRHGFGEQDCARHRRYYGDDVRDEVDLEGAQTVE